MDSNENDFINIIIPASSFYVPYLSALLVSILCNKNKEDKLFFHILTEDITEKDKHKLAFLKFYGEFKIEYVYPNSDLIAGIKECVSKHINNLCNYKLHISSLFPNIHKAIILEGDMIVLSSLKELYDIDINDTPFAAVKDPWIEDIQETQFDIPKKYRYCNTGMFLANLDLWRKLKIEDVFKDIIKKYNDKLLFPDQDIFNIAFHKVTKHLPAKWNIYVNINYNHIEEQKEAYEQGLDNFAGIIHYAASDKPWNKDTNCSEHFWFYARKTPFYEKMLENYLQKDLYFELEQVFKYKNNFLKYLRYVLINKLFPFYKKEHYLEKEKQYNKLLSIAKKIRGV